MSDIRKILFEIFDSDSATIESRLLGGMMNETYIVNFKNKRYVVFIPQGNANDVVDREEEKYVQKIASELDVTSKNYYFNINTGIKCHEYIEGKSLNNVDNFDYEKIGKLLLTFHNSKKLSHYSYSPFEKLENYQHQVTSFMTLDVDFSNLFGLLEENKSYLEKNELVLSHNDFQKSNIIKTPNNDYKVIDFEFVANNDPIYDIAGFGNNDVLEGRKLLDAYYCNKPTKDHIKRFYLWRIFISLQWYLMAMIKDHNGEGILHNFDFKIVANHFLNNAKISLENLNNECR